MTRFALLASALLVAGMPAMAADPTPAASAGQSDKNDPNKIVCRREEQIGSRLGAKKVCLSVKEWQDREQADRESTERLQRQAGTRPSG